MIGVFVCGSAQADTLPEGMFLHATLGDSFAKHAGIQDSCFDPYGSGCGIISGDPNDESPGRLNKIGSSAIFGLGADYTVIPSLRLGIDLRIRDGFHLKDHDGHPANPLLNDPGSLTMAKGAIHAYSAMATAAYDLPVALDPVQPFISGGFGISVISTNSLNSVYEGQSYQLSGDMSGHASAELGCGLAVSVTPDDIIDIGYQFAWLGALRYKAGSFDNGSGAPPLVSTGFKGHLDTQDLTISYRFHF